MDKRTKDEIKAYNDKIYASPKGRARMMFMQTYNRSKKNNIEFTLTKEDFSNALIKGICEVTGLQFSLKNDRNPFVPSVDRVNPNLGYTRDNCKFVCWGYNAAKGVGTHEQVLIIAKAIVNNY